MTYDKLHVTFDKYDVPVTQHCLRCNTVIARRDDVPSERYPGMVSLRMVRAPNYREVYVELSDGTIAYLPHCQECIKEPLDKDGAMDAVKRGWEEELRQKGRPEEALQAQRDKVATLTIFKAENNANAR